MLRTQRDARARAESLWKPRRVDSYFYSHCAAIVDVSNANALRNLSGESELAFERYTLYK